MSNTIGPPAPSPFLTSGPIETPSFSPTKVSVIFVLGGPGAGKGTQCANIVKDYGFTHLSAGDLLRAEQERPGSEFGEMIKDYIKRGAIVPMEVTVQLLENAMREVLDGEGRGRFLVDGMCHTPLLAKSSKKDSFLFLYPNFPFPSLLFAKANFRPLSHPPGFPRKMDQALKFESSVCPSAFTLFFDCPESVMQERLLNRGKTSGRADDNEESIKKRFKTFVETSMPVVEYFEGEGRVDKVDATRSSEEVYESVRGVMRKRGF
ncbi:MAG: hypothetical protein MMC33_006436 [Icmadophila ericetorum]|nr:hypothetical protein [Icmadophila ericetorum]